ncbi:hypothetical protein [Ramlibacter humi]|uniref:Uncharacterized protein n=1 Tax=Ramlibacter humi TaxID=2530451 RepID=A0A4Z0CC01_9BURK|nr:hypothetical protein [Ramlibacter humi]TFZ07589.1 hypothetical protein EZ216_00015 [Ramlibacter humi]
MARISSLETRLLRQLVRLSGRDPEGFEAQVLDGGRIRVHAPCGAAFYPTEAWTSHFMLHLHQGWFDARNPILATGGTG